MELNRISKFSFLKQFINNSLNNFRKKVESFKFGFYNYLITHLFLSIMNHKSVTHTSEAKQREEIDLLSEELPQEPCKLESEDESCEDESCDNESGDLYYDELESLFDEDECLNIPRWSLWCKFVQIKISKEMDPPDYQKIAKEYKELKEKGILEKYISDFQN
jgi:hypothetical protein